MRKTRDLSLIIMAAGKGTRMKSDLAKVLHPLGGRAMIHFVIETARELQADPIVVVVGHQKEQVMAELGRSNVRFATQEPQLGTGHAVMCALPHMEDASGSVLILSGDVPLIKSDTLQLLIDYHFNSVAIATVMTAATSNPKGYGRIVRDSGDTLAAIIEERDAGDKIRRINEINSGIYVFDLEALRETLPKLTTDNDQKEYYLTDAVRLLAASGRKVGAFRGEFEEVMGINTIVDLESASRHLSGRELHSEGTV
jgi:UDP-N-acetylglucosamine diphosphorylase/glucosamine-1-phosphate N-acetyltransferase